MPTAPAVVEQTFPIGSAELFTATVVNKLTNLPPASATCTLTVLDATGATVTTISGSVDAQGALSLNASALALTEGAVYRFELVVQENAATKRTMRWWARAVYDEPEIMR